MRRVRYDTKRKIGVRERRVNGMERGCVGSYKMWVREKDLRGGRERVGSREDMLAEPAGAEL
jgi:hypothetical protein